MWPIKLPFLLLIFCSTFLSFLTLFNSSSFLKCSVQLIFSVLIQHHITKLFRYFWSTFRSVQGPAPYKALLQIYHSASFFLQFTCKSNLLVKRVVFLLKADLLRLRHCIWEIEIQSTCGLVFVFPKDVTSLLILR